jgi:hypothetical protein
VELKTTALIEVLEPATDEELGIVESELLATDVDKVMRVGITELKDTESLCELGTELTAGVDEAALVVEAGIDRSIEDEDATSHVEPVG